MGKTKEASKWEKENCPACGQQMNICREETGLYYCDKCHIHFKDGEIKNSDVDGEFITLAHSNPELKLVDKNTPGEKQKPQSIDFYFNSGDKKCFRDITASEPRDGWIILAKKDGREVIINARNVNYLEEL